MQEQTDLIESRDSLGRVPIHAAAINENSKCLPLLINAGANVNAQCNESDRGFNKTSLHICSEYGYVQNVEVLLAAGASTEVKDINGLNALQLAEKSGHEEIVKLLKKAAGEFPRIRIEF